ncbi:MAG: hypothetical protein ACI9YR_002108, partial [Bacteroidia bacterium]
SMGCRFISTTWVAIIVTPKITGVIALADRVSSQSPNQILSVVLTKYRE